MNRFSPFYKEPEKEALLTPFKFSELSAKEQKKYLVLKGFEPGSNEDLRLKQYREFYYGME